MIYSYKITKYSPTRTKNDAENEWTSFSDIGDKVSEKEYIEMEDLYIKAVQNISIYMKEKNLKIKELENYSNIANYKEDQLVNILNELPSLLRFILREQIWCKLEGKVCSFHFGYDYYMYAISENPIPQDDSLIGSKLFIESYKSPYLTTLCD